MEDPFATLFTLCNSQNQQELDKGFEIFQTLTHTLEFGPFILEKCFSLETNQIIPVKCLQDWISNNWTKLDDQQKQQITNSIISTIPTKEQTSSFFFDALLIISSDTTFSSYTYSALPSLIESIGIANPLFFEQLIYFIYRLFKTQSDTFSSPIEINLQLYQQYFWPLFSQVNLYQEQYFKSFQYLFKSFGLLQPFINQNQLFDFYPPLIQFARIIVNSCNDSALTSRSAKFLRSIFANKKLKERFNEIKETISDEIASNIHRFILTNDDSTVYQFLRALHTIGLKLEYLPILIESAKLSEKDVFDFHNNPFVFYSSVYTTKGTTARSFPLQAIDTLVGLSPELFASISSLAINELSMRIYAILMKYCTNPNFNEMKDVILKTALESQFDDPIEITSLIFLILNSPSFKDDNVLNSLFLAYFDSINDVARILLCKIVKNMRVIHPEIPIKIFGFLMSCPKSSPIKALKHIAAINSELLSPLLQPLVVYSFESLNEELRTINRETLIMNYLFLLSEFVGPFLQLSNPDDFFSLTTMLLSLDDLESDTIETISFFFLSVLKYCNENCKDYISLINNFLVFFLQHFQSSNCLDTFITDYGSVFIYLISYTQQTFLDLNISAQLIGLLLSILSDSKATTKIIVCDIISLIVQIDTRVDCCSMLLDQCTRYFTKPNEHFLLHLALGLSNILSSILLIHKSYHQIQILQLFVNITEKYIRIYKRQSDKHLTSLALLAIAEDPTIDIILKEEARQIATLLYQKELDADVESDDEQLPSVISMLEDYPFLLPIQHKKIAF